MRALKACAIADTCERTHSASEDPSKGTRIWVIMVPSCAKQRMVTDERIVDLA